MHRVRRETVKRLEYAVVGRSAGVDEGFAKVARVATRGMETGFGPFQGLGALALGIDDRDRVWLLERGRQLVSAAVDHGVEGVVSAPKALGVCVEEFRLFPQRHAGRDRFRSGVPRQARAAPGPRHESSRRRAFILLPIAWLERARRRRGDASMPGRMPRTASWRRDHGIGMIACRSLPCIDRLYADSSGATHPASSCLGLFTRVLTRCIASRFSGAVADRPDGATHVRVNGATDGC